MNTEFAGMPSLDLCPECGAELPSDAPAGMCPRCLLGAAMPDSPLQTLHEMDSSITEPSLIAEPAGEAGALPAVRRMASRAEGNRSSAPSVGTKGRYFGNYELLEDIARGGMGAVYKARQIRLNRIVALKMILAGQFASPSDVQRFHTEAESAAQLDHPAIVPVFEVGEHEGLHFFSMGYVDGGSLSSKLTKGPLPPRTAAAMLHTVAMAVQYAHEHGVIHRDLKPGNILIDSLGQPRVTDFGLAKRVRGDSGLTVTGQILGTPSYMPPEQAAGRQDDVKEAADIYSLGAILYVMVTGRPPFQADNPLDTLRQVLDRDPVAPRQLNPSVPRDLETICLKCLEKLPSRRYASAKELADELQRFLNGEPILARPVSQPARLWKWCRRNRVVAVLLLAVAVSLLVGATVSAYFAFDASRRAAENLKLASKEASARIDADVQKQQAIEHAKTSEQRRMEAEENARRAYLNQYAADMNLARRAWDDARIATLDSILNRYLPHSGQEDLRGFEWHWWKRMAHQEVLTIAGIPCQGMVYSPDGRQLAQAGHTLNGEAVIKIFDAQSGVELRALMGHKDHVSAIAYRHDGMRLATCDSEGHVAVWDPLNGTELLRFRPTEKTLNAIDFSPDGRRFVTGDFGGNVEIWDAATGEHIAKVGGKMGTIFSTRFHSGGELLVLGAGTQLIIWDMKAGTRVFERNSASTFGLSGDYLAVQFASTPDRGDLPIHIYELSPGKSVEDSMSQPILTLPTDGVRMMSTGFTSAGDYLAACGTDRRVRLWEVRTAQLVNTFKGHENITHVIAFSPDGQRLACASMDGLIKVWPTAPEPSSRRLPAGDVGVNSLNARYGSFAVETQQRRGTPQQLGIEILDTATGRVSASLPLNQPVIHMSLNADATRVSGVSTLGILHVWDLQSGRELWQLRREGNPKRGRTGRMDFSPDGRLIAYSDTSGSCRVLDAVNGEQAWVPPGLDTGARNLKFDPSGTRLMTISPEGILTAWDVAERRVLWTQAISIDRAMTMGVSNDGRQVAMGNVSTAIAFSDDGRQLALGASGGRIIVCDAETGRQRAELPAHALSVEALTFAPDGHRLASYGVDRMVKLWDLRSGRELGVLETDQEELKQLAFVDDGLRLVGVGPKSFVSWDARPVLQSRIADLLPARVLSGSPLSVLTVGFAHDGSLIATAGYDKAIYLWDSTSGVLKQKLTGHEAMVRSAVFSSDSQRLYSASGDKTIRIWEIAKGELIETLRDNAAAFRLALSPDERWLAVGSSATSPRLWDLQTKQIALELSGHTGSAQYVDITSNGKLLATGCRNGIVKLWDAEGRQLLQTLPLQAEGMSTVRLSPDGSLLATTVDSMIELRKIPTGELAMQFAAPKPINGAAFSADGRRYAAASGDGNVRLWDVESGRFLQMLRGGGQSIAFSPDGKRIVSGAADGRVCVFQLNEDLLSQELDHPATESEPDRFGFGRIPASGVRSSGPSDRK